MGQAERIRPALVTATMAHGVGTPAAWVVCRGLMELELAFSFEAVEFATLEWVDWFNSRRLLSSIGNVPQAEAEAAYYASLEELKIAA
jgi:transposase InsO family protein